jgi:hemoglobin-like flavoprotein
MTNNQIQIVKKTWSIVAKLDPSVAGTLFYTRLFAGNPEIKSMFKTSIKEQSAKLITMINYAVSKLDKPTLMLNDVAKMAKRHVEYGVQPGHYLLVGNALIWTLAQALDEHWTEETRTAWSSCYTMLSNTMIEAAYGNLSSEAA